jgi:DNA ligase-1
MTRPFEPMTAATVKNLADVKFPVLGSPKIDGFRCVIRDGKALTRSLMPFPNLHLNKLFNKKELNGLDGEIVAGDPFGEGVYSRTSSAVTSVKGEPSLTLYAFDVTNAPDVPYWTKRAFVVDGYRTYPGRYHSIRLPLNPNVLLVQQWFIQNLQDLEKCLADNLDAGYEGIMLRSPQSLYKYGRSTMREQYLMKVKPFEESDCVVLGVEEKLTNTNEEGNAGRRRTLKAGMVPAGTLGKMLVRDLKSGAEFYLGLGKMTHAEAALHWANRDARAKEGGIVGRVAKYKFQRIGMVTSAPRQPIWLAWREKFDLGK